MVKILLSLCMLMFAGPSQQPAAVPAVPVIPPEAKLMTNPARPTAEGVAHAKKMYGYDCAVCHGETGNGKGELAVESKLVMKDWTDPATLKVMTDGELFYIITHGQGTMPAEGDRAKPEDIWNMVAIVRSFSKP